MKDPLFNTLAERFADHTVDVDPGTWSAISGKLAVANGSSLSELLQEKFTGHEAPVDPQVWTNISSQLGHGAAAGVGSTTGWWAAGIAATLVAGGLLLYTSMSEDTPATIAQQPEVSAPVAIEQPPNDADPVNTPAASIQTPNDAQADTKVNAGSAPPVTAPLVEAVPTAPAAENTTNGASAEAVPGTDPPLVATPTPEGEKTVNTVLQSIVDNYVTSPIVVVTEKKVPPPTQDEMPSPVVHPQHDEQEVAEQEPAIPEIRQATPEISVLIPTAFSPNGDGINDELEVSVQHYQKATVRIFSASNNALVFAADNLEAKWNGRIMNSGQPCEPGMYFYALEVTDAEGRMWSKGEVVRLFQR